MKPLGPRPCRNCLYPWCNLQSLPHGPLTLDEVCSRMSLTDRRVELIGAFHADEKANGRTKDTETAYKARFVAFCKQPA